MYNFSCIHCYKVYCTWCNLNYSCIVWLGLLLDSCPNTFRALALGNVSNEIAFFKSLVPVILRHKARLNRTVRDVIISTWLDWLNVAPLTRDTASVDAKENDESTHGSMESAAHEYLIFLLNEWANFGNKLMPRDLLFKVATEVVQVVNATELLSQRKISELWKSDSNDNDFGRVKAQYERLLSLLPETRIAQWKESAGIEVTEEADVKPMEIGH